jgi:predicted amidohydrolase YtcJ
MSKATHIYHNGIVVTMDSRCSVTDNLAVSGDRILGTGSLTELSAFRDKTTAMVNLHGATMLPGFYDAHSHVIRAGFYSKHYLDISAAPVGAVKNMDDICKHIAAAAAKTPKGEWIRCFAYDDTGIAEQRHFTLAELDAICPDHPLYLRHVSGHLGLANSLALRIANITSQTPDPPGGTVRRDAQGNPTGLLEEPVAMELVQAKTPQATHAEWVEALKDSTQKYAAKGVTTAHEGGTTTDMWDAYFDAHARGFLRCRVQLLPRHGSFDFSRPNTAKGGSQLTADGMLSLGAVKIYQDGSIQGYTGSLSNPYYKIINHDLPDGPFWRGYSIRSQNEFTDMVTAYHKAEWQIAVHGNGDQAIDEILNAFEAAQRAYPRADARHIIIHCQTAREDQLDRISRLGIMPSFFVVHTYFWGDRHREIFLGPCRARRINPLKSALKRSIRFTNHNDTFVTPIDPLLSVWSAVNRLTSSGKVLGEEQRINVVDALRSVTIWGAYQFNEDKIKGSLEPGKYADMVVLAENPLAVAPERIKDIPVVATLVGNNIVYGAT